MRIQTAFRLISRASTKRLARLAIRLDFAGETNIRPRHAVRLMFINQIAEVVRMRVERPLCMK